MPGGLPVYALTVRRLVDRLRAITKANGYTFDANVVVPRFADEETKHASPDVVVIVGRPRPSEAAVTGGAGYEYVARQVEIVAYLPAPQDADEPLSETHDRIHSEVMLALKRHDTGDRIAEKVVWIDSPDDTPVDGPAAIVVLDLHTLVQTGDHTKGRP